MIFDLFFQLDLYDLRVKIDMDRGLLSFYQQKIIQGTTSSKNLCEQTFSAMNPNILNSKFIRQFKNITIFSLFVYK